MRRNRWLGGVLAAACCVVAGLFWPRPAVDSGSVIGISEADLFWTDAEGAARVPLALGLDRRPSGILLPHHLPVAAGVLKSAYAELAAYERDIAVVVLLAPDHEEQSAWPLTTTEADFDTPVGRVRSATASNRQVMDELGAGRGQTLFETEHGIYAHLPFIRRYLPEARIVPLAFSARMPPDRAAEVGRRLAAGFPEGSLFVLSVDLSHYLPHLRADQQDADTIRRLAAGEVASIQHPMVDSAPATQAFLAAMRARGALPGAVYYRGNSAALGGNPDSTTGYAVISYPGRLDFSE